jgi:hypothetical protein
MVSNRRPGGWQPFSISPETAVWGRKCETGRCLGERARYVLAKVRGDVFVRFHAVVAKVAVEPGIHSLVCWYRCFALSQLLYRWRHQSGIFWIPPRISWSEELAVGSNWEGLSSAKYRTGSSVCYTVCPSSNYLWIGQIEEGFQADGGSFGESVDNGFCGSFRGRGGFLLCWVNHLCLPVGRTHPSEQYQSYPTLICVPSHKGCFLEPK